MSTADVVRRYAGVWSKRQIYAHVRGGLIPHLKLPGRRDLLFRIEDLERYERGDVDLETVQLPLGGRICRLRNS